MLPACSIRLTSRLAPLFDAEGNLKFFIGGQINCSTTIRSNTDVLKILSMSDDPEDDKEAAQSVKSIKPNKRSFFRFPRKERYVIACDFFPLKTSFSNRRTNFGAAETSFPLPCYLYLDWTGIAFVSQHWSLSP